MTEGSYASLLDAPSVAEELKLTEGHKARLRDATRPFRAESLRLFRKVRDTNGGRGEEADQLRAEIVGLQRAGDEAVLAILDRRQRVRLEQIALQQEGPWALTRPEFAARLNMHPGRSEVIRALFDEYEARTEQERQREAERLGPVPDNKDAKAWEAYARGAKRHRHEEARRREALVRSVFKVLRPKQREASAAMLGAPFDLETLSWNAQVRRANADEEWKRTSGK